MNPSPQPPPRARRGGANAVSQSALGVLSVLAVVLIAFGLRFHNLGGQSLWNDEGSSYVQATRSFIDIADNAARDIHPPGYYWLLAVWRGLTGDSEFALRSLSAFASVLTVAFTYALGKRLFSPLAGLFAALFVTLNTFSIYYAQEARMYALLALWSVMGMWALSRVLGRKEGLRTKDLGLRKRYFLSTQHSALSTVIALAIINAAGLYTQYAYPFVMLAQGAVIIAWIATHIFRRGLKPLGYQKTKRTEGATKDQTAGISAPLVGLSFPAAGRFNVWQNLAIYILANLLAILLYLPWLPTALHQVTSWPSTGQPIPAGEAFNTILGLFAFGIKNPSQSVDIDLLMAILQWLIAASVLLIVFGILQWLHKRQILWQIALPVLWVGVPVGIFFLLGLFRPANLKFLLPSQIGLALIMGIGVGGLRHWTCAGGSRVINRVLAIACVIPIAAYSLALVHLLYTDPAYQRADYRGMVRQITADPRPGDAIILDAPNQEEVFRYYYKGDAPVYPLPPGLGGDDAETLAAVEDIIACHDRIFVLYWGEAERDPNRIVETTLDQGTFQAGIDVWYGDVRFARYDTPADMPQITPSGARFGENITLHGYALNTTALQPGDVLQVRLDWTTDAALDKAYKVFVQLLNSDGVLMAQRDSEPGGGSQPTTGWRPGERVTDLHGLAIPVDLPAGEYILIVGLYDRDDAGARLAVNGGDYLELAQIVIEE